MNTIMSKIIKKSGIGIFKNLKFDFYFLSHFTMITNVLFFLKLMRIYFDNTI